MKTKDEIREAEMYSILRKHKLPLKKREDLMVDLTNFTHSQLKEQQEEIEQLKAENQELRLMNYEADELEIDYKATCLEQQEEIERLKEEIERLEKLHGTGELGETLRIERKLVISELHDELRKTRREEAKLQKELDELRDGIKAYIKAGGLNISAELFLDKLLNK
jgi:predicted RNase H-like nuclease (RuvC/YqgF family)